MAERGVQSKKRYIISVIIGTIVFLLVIGLSYWIALYQYTTVADTQGATAYSLFEKKLGYSFFGENICSDKNLGEISQLLGQQGRIIEDLENKFGKTNQQVLERKKFYSVLLLEHLDYVNAYNANCVTSINSSNNYQNTILFFYSNLEKNDLSNNAGKILDRVGTENGHLSIYSFDISLNSTVITKLKEKYGITSAPAIIIDQVKVLNWPFSVPDVESYLKTT